MQIVLVELAERQTAASFIPQVIMITWSSKIAAF